jgi:hypothetical protein
MTDELQQASSQQEILPEPQVSTSLPVQPKKSNKNIWIIVGVAVVVLCCLFSIACVALFGTSMYKVYTEKAPVESVLNNYMRYMANKDAKNAYALLSPRAQRQIPTSKVQEMLEGNNYFLFEGYQSLSVSNLNISAVANTNPDVPQGTVAKVIGVINFEGGIQGSFNGTLEKVDGKWMIDGMYVTVPPDKIK